MKNKKVAKKKSKAVAKKPVRHELVVRVQQATSTAVAIPTQQELTEPIKGKDTKLTIPKTWLSSAQIIRLVEKTPSAQIYKRPGKGGKVFDYVTVSYMQRVLDYTFGWNWDFEVLEHGREADHVWVMGKLTVRNPDGTRSISKTQFGRSEIKFKKDSDKHVDYGNDLKAAASDALKKCASMLGIARDIYGKTDYKQETGHEPKDAPQPSVARAVKDIQEKHNPDTHAVYPCLGVDGKGCRYGITEVAETVANYSKKRYGKILCADCQKDAKPLK